MYISNLDVSNSNVNESKQDENDLKRLSILSVETSGSVAVNYCTSASLRRGVCTFNRVDLVFL